MDNSDCLTLFTLVLDVDCDFVCFMDLNFSNLTYFGWLKLRHDYGNDLNLGKILGRTVMI